MKTLTAILALIGMTFLTGCVGSPMDTQWLSNPSMTAIEEVPESSSESAELCQLLEDVGVQEGVDATWAFGKELGLTDEELFDHIALAINEACPEHLEEMIQTW